MYSGVCIDVCIMPLPPHTNRHHPREYMQWADEWKERCLSVSSDSSFLQTYPKTRGADTIAHAAK